VIDPAGECLGQAVGGLGERFGDIVPSVNASGRSEKCTTQRPASSEPESCNGPQSFPLALSQIPFRETELPQHRVQQTGPTSLRQSLIVVRREP
jgi:hypothetical protein